MALRRPKLPTPRPVLTAAASPIELGRESSWKSWKFGNREWQVEAWRLYDIVPELTKLAGRTGKTVAQARLYVAELDERGEEVAETTDPRISALAGIPLGTGPQRDDNLRMAGTDLAVGGECWIVGEGVLADPESGAGEWFVVTSSALSREGDRIKVKRPRRAGGSGGSLLLTDGQDTLTRCWRPHPNDADQAESFTRSCIPVLREIELLTKREFAELDSRLIGAGVQFLPEGIDYPRGKDDPEGIAGFMAYVQRAAAASIRDQSTAQALVPIMATVPDGTDLAALKEGLINYWSPISGEIGGMKLAAIERLASTADLPKETITGLADMNHWSGWLATEEGVRWIKEYLGLIADALTRGFLRVVLPSIGVDPARYAFAFDVSALAAKPNRLEDAIVLHDRFLISDEEAVKAGAFDPEQMPTVQERAAQVLLKLITIQPDLILDPGVQELLGLPAMQSVGLPPTADQNADAELPEEQGEPEQEDPDVSESRSLTLALEGRIRELGSAPIPALPSPEAVFNASAKLLVYRALELAGGRLTTPQERRGRWAEIPRHELHSRVGPITRDKALRVTEGAWNHVTVTASDLGVEPEDLRALLEGYVLELLTRGIPHHDDLLFAALNIAHRGRGLVAA